MDHSNLTEEEHFHCFVYTLFLLMIILDPSNSDPDDIHASILRLSIAAALPADDYARYQRLIELSLLVKRDYEQSGEMRTLEICLRSLSQSMEHRPGQTKELSDVESSIHLLQWALEITPTSHTDRAWYLYNLGSLLLIRFEHTKDMSGVEKSIHNLQLAAELPSNDPVRKADCFSELGKSYICRFEKLGSKGDIEASIDALQKAIAYMPSDPTLLGILGAFQLRDYQQFGDLARLEASVSNLLMANAVTDEDSPNKAIFVGDLGNSQLQLFERRGRPADLQASIMNLEKALKLNPDPNNGPYLSNLANAQHVHFLKSGNMADIDASISNLHCAIELSNAHDYQMAVFLSNIGGLYVSRFLRLGDIADIEAAISNLERAIEMTPDHSPRKMSCFKNLGVAHSRRFERQRNAADVDASISNLQRAIELTPKGHRSQAGTLASLGQSLMQRFFQNHDKSDLDLSISNVQKAVDLTSDDHPDKGHWLSQLGTSRIIRSDFDGGPDGGHAERIGGILNIELALELIDPDNPMKARYLIDIGLSYRSLSPRFYAPQIVTQLNSGEASNLSSPPDFSNLALLCIVGLTMDVTNEFLTKAVAALRSAANSETAYPVHALHAATLWAQTSHHNDDHHSALDGYRTALGIIPKVAWLGLDVTSRESVLAVERSEELACNSAACAIQYGRLEEAVELLDMGRSICWQQASRLRKDLNELKDMDPDLAAQFELISRQIEQTNFSGSIPASDIFQQQNLHHVGKEHRRLAACWEETVKRVRDFPSLCNFLKPAPYSTLRQVAKAGQVVIVNVSRYGVDALILDTVQAIQHVSLPDINLQTLSELAKRVQKRPSLIASANERRYYVRQHLKPVLQEIWKTIIVPILNKLDIPLRAEGGLPERRVWWYPTGPLTFIPIHAAGPYDKRDAVDVSQLIVSSYVTTLESLLQAQRKAQRPIDQPHLLTMSQPNTSGQSPLPRSLDEINIVTEAFRSAGWSNDNTTHLDGCNATVGSVLSALGMCSWAHLACHGIQDSKSSTKSELVLHDGGLQISDIASKRLENGRFVYLSACHGASGIQELPGEAMHLAGGLHFAGFPGVIATLWYIRDEDAPTVAQKTYLYMFHAGNVEPDPSDAAVALNRAVIALRNEGATLDRWAAYIHIGI